MAIGTITIASTVDLGHGARLYKCSFAGDADYTTGGTPAADVLAALKLAIKTAELAASDTNVRGPENPTIFDVIGGDCGQYEAYWKTAGLKVLDGGHATRDEIAAHADVHLTTFNVTFITK
jgi:hypothetical protein